MRLQNATDRRPVALVLFRKRVDRAATGAVGDDRERLVRSEPALTLLDQAPEVTVVATRLRHHETLDARIALGNVLDQFGPFIRVNLR